MTEIIAQNGFDIRRQCTERVWSLMTEDCTESFITENIAQKELDDRKHCTERG